MSKSKIKQDPEEFGRYNIERQLLGREYDPSKIDAKKFHDVMPRPEGYYKPYQVGVEPPPEGHVDDTPHGRSIIERGQIINPPEVDELGAILDGHDRWDIALRYGIPCMLVRVVGLREDQKRTYVAEVNTARRDNDLKFRQGVATRHMEREEAEFGAGRIKYRSTYNRLALSSGLSLRQVRRLERANFPARWQAACEGETRLAHNDRTFAVKEADPGSQIKELTAKLTEETPVDQQEAAIRALREVMAKHEDLLGSKDRKDLRAQVDDADHRLRQRKAAEEAAEEQARLASQAARDGLGDASGGVQPDAGDGGDRPEASVAEVLDAIDSEPEIEDLDGRPFTTAVSLYLAQRLLRRDDLSTEEEWWSRVGRAADRCGVDSDDLLRLLRLRASSLEPMLRAMDRLFLAGGVDPVVLRDALSKHVLEAFLQAA